MLLLISIEIIGNYFINELEKQTITNFQEKVTSHAEQLASYLSVYLVGNNELDHVKVNDEIQKQVESFGIPEVIEIRVVDDQGIIRAAYGNNSSLLIDTKNDYSILNRAEFNKSIVKENDERFQINVQPIFSNLGNGVVGALYIKSNLEKEYGYIHEIAKIFFTASLISLSITVFVSSFVAISIIKPIESLRKQAVRISGGDFSEKTEVAGHDELSQLSLTFNELADHIQENQELLKSERNRLNSVLEYMNDGVIATERRGKVMIINEMALSQLNVEEQDVIGHSIIDLLGIKEEYTLRNLLEDTPNILFTPEDTSSNNYIKSTYHVDFSVLRRESGALSGLVAVLHDVTEQQKIEQERRQFVSNVSHELRTPLTSVQSYLETLLDGALHNEEVAQSFLETTLNETNRMIRMINDLFQLSKMDSGVVKLDVELVNFNAFVNYILDRFVFLLGQNNDGNISKKYDIVRQFTNQTLWLYIDPDKMTQVIDNIINNAIKYSPDGGQIKVRLLETQKAVILSVYDEGLGIPKADLKKIFDRFFRVDKARTSSQGGTGLGLAIAKEIIQAHGGHIWVESHEGVGSNFYLSLPYQNYEDEVWEL